MRRLKYVLQSAIACFVVAGAMLVLFWGAGIYNIYHESHGNISDLSELWSYISEQGLMFLIGLLAFVSFLVSGFQAKKASEADRAANGGNEYDGVGYGDADYSGTINAGGGYTYDSMDTSIKLDEGSGMEMIGMYMEKRYAICGHLWDDWRCTINQYIFIAVRCQKDKL